MERLFINLSILILLLTGCVDESDLDFPFLNEPKTEQQENLLEAVYITPPANWKKARSYDGYQAPRMEGSIELREDRRPVAEVAKDYTKDILSGQRKKLRAFRNLTGTSREGFYVKLDDPRSKAERQLLIFEGIDRTWILKGFCREAASGAASYELYDALMSVRYDTTAIAKPKMEAYVLAKLVKLEPAEMWLTRNGDFPPTTEDELKIHSREVSDGGIVSMQDEVRLALKVSTGSDGVSIYFKPLVNGKTAEGKTGKDGKYAGVFLIANLKKGGTIFTVSANNEASIDEALFWIKDRSMGVMVN